VEKPCSTKLAPFGGGKTRMDDKTLVAYMMKTAKQDILGNKGRIIISDFLKDLPADPKPDSIEMLKAWRRLYPHIEISMPFPNIIIIQLSAKRYEEAVVEEEVFHEERIE